MEPMREDIVDAETGERLIRVRQKEREYLRRAPKGKKQKLNTTPEMPPDETGVTADGGNRIAQTPAGPIDLDNPGVAPSAAAEVRAGDGEESSAESEQVANDDEEQQIDLPDLTEADAAFLEEAPVEPVNEEEQRDQGDEPDQQSVQVEPREEPETDERRMIAAE
jgi:hypothetical protein